MNGPLIPRTWAVLGAIAAIALGLGACDRSTPPPARPAAGLSVPPGLSVAVDGKLSVLLSGSAVKGETVTPLFRARLTSGIGPALTGTGAPSGDNLRLRVAEAPMPARGEEMTWIKNEPGQGELPAGSGEYVYTGGAVTVHINLDESGKIVFTPEGASGTDKK